MKTSEVCKTFKLRKEIQGVNYYSLIEVAAEATTAKTLEIEYIDVDPEWYSSIDFSVRYFFHYFAFEHNKGLKVCVKRLHTMIGDTTPMTVFFVTIKCLTEIFNHPEQLVNLDETSGSYIVLR